MLLRKINVGTKQPQLSNDADTLRKVYFPYAEGY